MKIKKLEYQLIFIYDLRVRGEVPFPITSKNLHCQKHSFLDFRVNLSGGAHCY